MINREESARRIKALQGELQQLELDAALLIHPMDIYYYSGTRQNSVLYVPATRKPTLLVRKSLIRARSEAGIEDVRPFPPSREFQGQLPEVPGRVGMCFDVTPVQQLNFYKKLLPESSFTDISTPIRNLRSVKSEHELELMRKSGDALCQIFAQIPEFMIPGMRELDLAAEFEYLARRGGNEGFIRMRAFNQELFQGLAVSGDSASHPGFFDGAVTGRGLSAASPQGASIAPIEANHPVMMDYTGVLEGYIVDMTRMFVFGKVRPEVRKAFDAALRIQDHLVKNLRPGQSCSQLFDQACEIARAQDLEEYFMGVPGENARFVGHGVGLELDEMPVLAKGFDVPLLSGQTIAIEPKFVLPGIGVVGIENTFAVSSQGGERLTRHEDEIVVI